jgi:CheY-like chemotaxis protein
MTDTRADVLVVDDDPDLREVVRTMLDISGYEVRCAKNGKEAVDAVAQKTPAVILLDMLMPVMDGWQCARELRARYGDAVPIVVVTAAEHARARANEIGGVDDVLPKPFDMDELLRVVGRYAEKNGADVS